MNKILNINLGGFAFTIDDDAFEYMSAYLDSIRRRFSASEGRDEILHDIENRLGELLTAELGNRSIVMLPDVEAAVGIMGKPEDFGGEPIDNRRTMGSKGSATGGTIRTGKRLFRDEEDKVAGGVCSGLAAYFGISDPVWMRLIFVLLTFISAGFWIPAYILLWILVQPARTAADRLAMRGQPINVDNIAREIEDGFERFGEKVNEYGAGSKKKSGINEPNKGRNILSSILTFIGSFFGLVVQFMAKFGVLILLLIAIAVFISLFFGWIGSFWGLMAAAPYVDYFSPFSKSGTYLGMTSIFLLLALPAIGLGLVLARIVFKFRTPGWLGAGMTAVWFINFFALITFGATGFKSFRHSRTLSTKTDLSGLRSDTLRLKWSSLEADGDDLWVNGDGLRLNDGNLQIRDYPDIRIRVSEAGNFGCNKNITARGSSPEEALDNARDMQFNPVLEGDVLLIPNYYTVPKGKKFRAQNMVVTILVPPGKFIALEDDVHHHVWDVEYANPDSEYRIGNYPGKPFRMTDRGLVCTDCPNIGDAGYRGGDSFDEFIIEGNMNVEIRRADRFSVRKEGPQSDQDKVQILRSGDKMTITTHGNTLSPEFRLYIEAPVFTDLMADNTGELTIRGFDEGRASISARGSSKIKAYFDSRDLDLNLNGPCSLELFGRGSDLSAALSDGAQLEAGAWRTEEVEISAYNGSKARVFARSSARISNDSSSEVKLEGGAKAEKNWE